MYRYFIRGSKN